MNLSQRRQRERELDEELRAHLRMAATEHVEQGETPEHARASVLREFGNVVLVEEVTRDMWGSSWFETLLQDANYGIRQLKRNPGFTAVAIITLALGIGANTAIFTLVDAVTFKSLPVANPRELYRLGNNGNCCVLGGMQDDWSIFSYSLYQQFRDHAPEFSAMAAFEGGPGSISVRRGGATGPAEPFIGEYVSGSYFSTLGIRAFAGRLITPEDDKSNAPPAVVISYRAWQQHFGLDTSLIGAPLQIDQTTYTVAGIAPRGFFGDEVRADPPDLWMPLATEVTHDGDNAILNNPGMQWLFVIGRLKPGVQVASLQSKFTVQLQQWLSVQPDLTARDRSQLPKQRIVLAPAGGGVARMQYNTGEGLRYLMIISGLVLLIACANIANLLLARGAAKQAETAVRMALGAARTRIIRQIITESVPLGIAGGMAGLLVAYLGTRTILLLAFRGAHYVPISATPSLAVLGFAFVVSFVTAIVFGIAPAWITSRSAPAEALRGAGRATRDRSSSARQFLVVFQVALSAVLLIGAGLLTQTLRRLENQNFGFETNGRVIVRLNADLSRYKPAKLYELYQQVERRILQIPGVVSGSYSIYSPMRGVNWSFTIHIQGHPPDEQIGASFDRVGPHYFETIGTRLLRGRAIGIEDTPTSPQVAVINAAFARKFFPHQDPMGKHFGLGDARNAGDLEIVGITEDAKYQDARKPAYPTFFLPFLQMAKDPKLSFMIGSHYIGDLELRVTGKPQNLESDIRRTLADTNSNLNVVDVLSLDEQVVRNFNQDRLLTRLTELFGALALILACVGLYGVTAYSVARRTSEFGIRMSLGANRGSVVAMVLRGVLLRLVIGLGIGIPVALAGGRLLSNQLYGVKAYDPFVLGAAIFVLMACTVAAGLVPARRAARVDPAAALRYE
jgi:predicted permease